MVRDDAGFSSFKNLNFLSFQKLLLYNPRKRLVFSLHNETIFLSLSFWDSQIQPGLHTSMGSCCFIGIKPKFCSAIHSSGLLILIVVGAFFRIAHSNNHTFNKVEVKPRRLKLSIIRIPRKQRYSFPISINIYAALRFL